MSYQVLARKWRPQNFKQMVGQEHVLQALVHALESQRLHHAYLFTGTRGVGKTTIGRILARCLSCDTGITSEPCGDCGACSSITQGRYVDLIEIDAASRTKVEDMRELLENVQYAPTEGRFKIYLIDEVHMLSTHSFNALLKTLEEPPEHVKFLFATTDPQKLPITILSRCLQFNLKNMTPERIVAHLGYVLSEEGIASEEPALWAIARAADGSMRDALSLTDQAIAYAKGSLSESQVSAMLGTVDQRKVYRLIDQLLARDASGLIEVIRDLAEYSPDFGSVLERVASIFHRVAVEQAVPGCTDNSQGDQEKIVLYSGLLSAEDTQLYYQVALVARKDLAISPDARSGFEMAMLRMLAFQLEAPESLPQQKLATAGDGQNGHIDSSEIDVAASDVPADELAEDSTTRADCSDPSTSHSVTSGSTEDVDAASPEALAQQSQDTVEKKKVTPPLPNSETALSGDIEDASGPEDMGLVQVADAGALLEPVSSEALGKPQDSEALAEMAWPRQAIRLGLSGMTQNLLLNMFLDASSAGVFMYVESGHFRLLTDNHKKRIVEAVQVQLKLAGPVEFVDGLQNTHETPAMWLERIKAERLRQAKDSLHADPNVQTLIAEFDARLIEESVVALGEVD